MSINDKRNTRILVKEIELVNGSNDYIYNFYLNLSESIEKIYLVDLDEETENKLLAKNDPFIDVILAQYCFYRETLQKLFSKSFSEDNLTLRLACLSNKTISKILAIDLAIDKLPEALFDSENNEEMLNWFSSITDQEVDTLFRNETIDDGFLTNLLELENDLWKVLSEDNKLQVIKALYYNERVCKKYEGPMDGYAEYRHNRLFSVIWDLAKKLPVEKKWSYALGSVLEKTRDDRYQFNSLEVADRWNIKEEEEEKNKHYLNGFELVRYACYRNIVKDLYGKDKTNKTHYTNEDIAYRACAYVQTDINEDDIREAYVKDKLLAIYYIMKNMRVWRNEELRSVLKEICWDADRTINNNYLNCANMFDYEEEELKEKYPDWFLDKEEVVIDEDDKVLTVGLGRGLLQEINYHQSVELLTEILSIKQVIEKSSKTLKWIFYGISALLLIEIFKR
ncbi:MAG: hypothetical protein KGQ58_08000 [Proteobacteria bacterium]|nr:hypothetical protein [Pseudomonadota bacterium]